MSWGLQLVCCWNRRSLHRDTMILHTRYGSQVAEIVNLAGALWYMWQGSSRRSGCFDWWPLVFGQSEAVPRVLSNRVRHGCQHRWCSMLVCAASRVFALLRVPSLHDLWPLAATCQSLTFNVHHWLEDRGQNCPSVVVTTNSSMFILRVGCCRWSL